MRYRSFILATAAVSVSCLHLPSARAQQAPATATTAPTETTLQEVVVTAQRRAEKLQEVPIAVTALTEQFLEDHPITTAKDLQLSVPSLNINTSNNRDVDRFSIRGQGTTAGSAPGVITYFADAPIPTNGGGPGIYYDLGDVQVLNGPQGTLFGRNTTGGAVLFDPKRPTNDFGGYIEGGYGTYNNQEVQGAINIPLVSDKLLLRVAGDERSRDGYTKDALTGNTYDNLNYSSARVSLTARPTDDIENYLMFNYLNENNRSTGLVLYAYNPNAAFVKYYGAAAAATLLADAQAWGPRMTALDQVPEYIVQQTGLVDQLRWDITDGLSVKNIFSYYYYKNDSPYDLDGTPLPIVNVSTPNGIGNVNGPGGPAADMDYFTDELQFAGKLLQGHLDWVAGGYAELDSPRAPNSYATSTVTATTTSHAITYQSETERSKALFVHGIYDLSQLSSVLDGFKLTAGYRYTWDHLSNDSFGYKLLGYPNLTPGGGCSTVAGAVYPNCDNRAEAFFQAGTRTLTLDYQIDPTTLAYVTSRTGYKIGGFNGAVSASSEYASFKPENVLDEEVGMKSDFSIGGMKARTNVAAFHSYYTDIQRSVGASVNGVPTTITSTAGDGDIYGFEFSGSVAPTSDILINTNYSYNVGTYDKVAAGVTGVSNLLGQGMPYLPRHKINIDGTYTLPFDKSLGDISLTGNITYTSTFRVSDLYYPGVYTGAYALVNFNASWNNVLGRPIDLQFYVNNALDRTYRLFNSTQYASTGADAAAYGEPRMLGFNAKYRF